MQKSYPRATSVAHILTICVLTAQIILLPQTTVAQTKPGQFDDTAGINAVAPQADERPPLPPSPLPTPTVVETFPLTVTEPVAIPSVIPSPNPAPPPSDNPPVGTALPLPEAKVRMEPLPALSSIEAVPNTIPVDVKDKTNSLPDKFKKKDPLPPQPILVANDVGPARVKNGKQIQTQLTITAITATSGLNIVVTLPTGLDYEDKSSKTAEYDPNARQLAWRNLDVDTKKPFDDKYRLVVNVSGLPASLWMTTTWTGSTSDVKGEIATLIQVGDERSSAELKRADGGKVRVSDRVELDFPSNALKADASITSTAYAPFVAPSDELAMPFIQFSLGPDMQFDKPVTVTVDTQGLFSDELLSLTKQRPTLQHLFYETITSTKDGVPITTQALRIEDIPSTYDQQTGLLVSHLSHFSEYQVSLQQPVNPAPWRLAANGGNINLFRGSVNYSYPIAVPGMVDGLQPNIALNYSSAAADSGFDQQYQPGENLSMGLGWSVEVPKITRAVKRTFVCGGTIDWQGQCSGAYGYNGEYANDFTLSLGGQTYNLVPKGGGEYVTEDYAPLKIRLCNDQAPCSGSLAIPGSDANGGYWGNTTGEYWQVWTLDGTRWLFGIDGYTENVVSMRQWDWTYSVERPYHPYTNAYSGYAGRVYSSIARAWFLRLAYAPNRDDVAAGRWSVLWNYETGTNTVMAHFWGCPNTCYAPTEPDPWSRPSSVVYGPSIKPDGSAATQRYKVTFWYGWGPRLLNITTSVADANLNTILWLRNYELGTGSGQILDGVREYGINSAGQWQSGLPRTNFYYASYPHGISQRGLLARIQNGYGGEWVYYYTCNPTWNSCYVTRADTFSGGGGGSGSWAGSWTGVKLYEYANPCITTSSAVGQCVNAAHVHFGDWPNNYAGFEYATEKVVDPGNFGVVYGQTQHRFYHTDLHKLGQEHEARTWGYDTNGAWQMLSAQSIEYFDWPGNSHGLPAGAWFVAPYAVNAFPFGDIGSQPYQRTVYEYDNNSTLIGANQTRKVNYGFVCGNGYCSGDEVTSKYGYYPNTSAWIVDKLAFENVYEGADETTEWPTIPFKTQTLLTYDANANYAAAPIKGQLKQVGSGHSGIPSEWAVQSISYDVVGNISAITDARNNTTNAYYDAHGWFLIEVQTPPASAGRLSTKYRYYGVDESLCSGGGFGSYGTLKCTVDPNGAATNYHYDVFGRLRKLAKPGDTFTHPTEEYFYYDTDAPFFVQRFVRKTAGVGTQYYGAEYGGWYGPGGVIDLSALAFWERTFYDGLGRAVQTQKPMADWATGGSMAIAWTSYDPFGRAWQQSMPYAEPLGSLYRAPNTGAAKTTTQYDGLGRVTRVTGADNAVTLHYYALDNVGVSGMTPTNAWMAHAIVDANNHAKHEVTDGLGRLRKVREFSGMGPYTLYSETNYAYDALSNLKQVVDAAGNPTTINYDALGRKTWMNDPDMGIWSYGYDPNGNLTSQTDAKNQTLTFEYDPLNRLTYKRHNGVALAWHLYDAWWDGTPKPNLKGRRTGAVAYVNGGWNNSKTWEYDARGRSWKHTTYTDVGNFNTYYLFDSADRVTQMTYPSGERAVTTYDYAGRPARLHSLDWYAAGTSVDYVSSASYNSLGQVKQLTFGNASRDQYDYYGLDIGSYWLSDGRNPYGRLWRKLVWSATNYPLLDMQSGYDGVGNVIGRLVSNNWGASWEGTRFSYDAQDRLTSATSWPGYVGESASVAYNAIGNLTSKSGVGSYDYATWGECSGYRPHAVRTAGGNGYCYDSNGNVTWRLENGVLYYQYWNADNKLIKVDRHNAVTWGYEQTLAEFAYDADGQRVKRVAGGVTTVYVGEHTELKVGVKWVQYYSLGGQRVAMRDNIGPTAGQVVWLHGDHLGSSSMATAGNGQAVAGSEARYTPYGEMRAGYGVGMPTNRKFTGHKSEDGIGLIDMHARYYSPLIGRFISADTIVQAPADPQSLNRFAYGRNSPLTRIDPTGHGDCNVHTTIGCMPDFIASQSLPRARMLITRYGGLIDTSHAWRSDVIQRVRDATNPTSLSNRFTFGPQPLGTLGLSSITIRFGSISAEYTVKKGLTGDEINRVAYGIWLDWSRRFESAQEATGDKISAFAPEDLFSDLLGFYQEYSGKSFQAVVNEDLGGVFEQRGDLYEKVQHPLEVLFGERVTGFQPWNPYTRQLMRVPSSIVRQLDVTPAFESSGLWRYEGEAVSGGFEISR